MGIEQADLGVGTRVQVRNRFLAEFRPGFEIAEVTSNGGYMLRRLSDGVQLPSSFVADDVQPDLTR
jgi:hypothetical protein